MKAIVLGSNGWFDTSVANTISILIITQNFNLILDAGLGFAKVDKYCDLNKPIYLFLSHLHLDHIFGLHTLAKFNFQAGLYIFGQPNLENDLTKILQLPFTAPLDSLPYSAKIINSKLPFEFELMKLNHASPCVGIRLSIENKVISYIADTKLCENCYKIAEKSDLLFAECAEKEAKIHLTPEICAEIAKKADAKNLVLIHFDPRNYPDTDSRNMAAKLAQKIFQNTKAGYDGLEIKI